MSKPMELIKSRIEELEELEQPIESPKPPPLPQLVKRFLPLHSSSSPDEDPYKPEKYEVEIFKLLEEAVEGKKKSVRFTVVDNTIDVIRQQLDIYGYAVYTLLYRFSYGYGRSTCAVSYGQVAKELKISSKKAELVLADLESRELVEVIFPPFKKLRGKVYKVKLPREYVKENEERVAQLKAFQELRDRGLL